MSAFIMLSFQTMIGQPLFWIMIGVFAGVAWLEFFFYRRIAMPMLQSLGGEELEEETETEKGTEESPEKNAGDAEKSEQTRNVWVPLGLKKDLTHPKIGVYRNVLECHEDFELKMLIEDYRKLGEKPELDAEELYYYSLISATLAMYQVCL